MALETVKLGWLEDYESTKFAPNTILNQVLTAGANKNTVVVTGINGKDPVTTISDANLKTKLGLTNSQGVEQYVTVGTTQNNISGEKTFTTILHATNGIDGYVVAGKKTNTTLGAQATAEGLDTTASGDHSHAEGFNTRASNLQAHAEGASTIASGQSSHSEGFIAIASGHYSHAEGYETTAEGSSSHAEGKQTYALGASSHAEGKETLAYGDSSHAEGINMPILGDDGIYITGAANANNYTYTLGEGCFPVYKGQVLYYVDNGTGRRAQILQHNETTSTIALSDTLNPNEALTSAMCVRETGVAAYDFSHVEGNSCQALGVSSHAEGHRTIAAGDASHSSGEFTIATEADSHVFGRYNIPDPVSGPSNHVEIVGNGGGDSGTARSNARTLDWHGNEWLAGSLTASTFLHHLITGTGTAQSGSGSNLKPVLWTFNLNIETPEEGDIINIKVPVAGHSRGVWVSTNSGIVYYPVAVNGTTRLQTQFAKDQLVSLIFVKSGSVSSIYPVNGAGSASSATTGYCTNDTDYEYTPVVGHWCVLNYYDANTNTLLRTYKAINSIELPLLLRNSANSQTAANATISTYSDSYGAIANANSPTVNPSTGILSASAGLVTTSLRLAANSATWKIEPNPINQTGELQFLLNDDRKAYITSAGVFGAVWNDYAEYRQSTEKEPGRCVKETGNDTLELTTKRLERGCEIISDTFGFAIGKTESCQTPVATSGRVLAYLYEGREAAASHIGWPVCSGPDGTVSIMTEEEEKEYPSRIIGTISAVPEYETWGEEKIKVNGRVWIRIK